MQDVSAPRDRETDPGQGLARRFGLEEAAPGPWEDGSASSAVYAALRARIVRLALPPGTPLPRAELAQTFGVSLTPLRDALQRLAEEGLVQIFPRSRTLVAPINEAGVREAQFMRMALEREVVRRLAGSMEPAGLDRLRAIQAAQAEVAGDPARIAQFQELDELFHTALFATAGHLHSQRLMQSRAGHLDRLRRLFLSDDGQESGPPRMDAVLRGHAEIIDALARRDPDGAVEALSRHLQRTVDRLSEKRAAFPQYFAPDPQAAPRP